MVLRSVLRISSVIFRPPSSTQQRHQRGLQARVAPVKAAGWCAWGCRCWPPSSGTDISPSARRSAQAGAGSRVAAQRFAQHPRVKSLLRTTSGGAGVEERLGIVALQQVVEQAAQIDPQIDPRHPLLACAQASAQAQFERGQRAGRRASPLQGPARGRCAGVSRARRGCWRVRPLAPRPSGAAKVFAARGGWLRSAGYRLDRDTSRWPRPTAARAVR